MEGEGPAYWGAAELAERSAGRTRGLRLGGLYVRGSLEGLSGPTVAVVGTRAPSEAGRRLANRLARRLGEAGVCVVSGLALGIDAAAHHGAVAAGARTIGVLGGGHGCFYPRANRGLADAIVAQGGAVVSPFEPQRPALPAQFLQRNAIIAALADAIVVVEAAARSGSLNTAAWAVDAGKTVMAFPGDVDRPKVAGCLALIRDGALLVRDADDVLAALPLDVAPAAVAPRAREPRTELERRVLDALVQHERSADELLSATGAQPGAILAALADLELTGAIERRGGTAYALAKGA
ncbi:MAG TPA: DNA-processing protein DprA [Candidatus Acidoferrales bacterium]|nr:DNA-processing protein DprA [Candidatus Acidoferrales bacterium]